MIYLDTETRSATTIRKGVHAYVRDPHFCITVVTWAVNDEPVRLWLPQSEPAPKRLVSAVQAGEMLAIHNSAFDRRVINEALLFGSVLPASQIHDTMVQAMAHGLPGGLEALGSVFGLSEDKAKIADGKRLIQVFCTPRKDKKTIEFHSADTLPAEWVKFCEYAIRDVETMRNIHRRLPTINYPKLEHSLWVLDQRINDRGIPVDIDLAEAAIREAAAEKTRLNASTNSATGGEVTAATQRDKLLMHLAHEHDIWLPDLKTSTLEARLEDEDLPTDIAELIALRLQSSQNSAAKYARVMQVQTDGRIRDTMQMYGASRTGRDAGRVFQPQNLKRPTMWHGLEGEELSSAIESDVQSIKDGSISLDYGNRTMEVLGNCVRGVIKAPEGRKLVIADLSNIEGRSLVWLSGEEWKLKYFRQYDTNVIAFDNYVAAYAKAFNIQMQDVTKSQRQIGKVMELGLGYGGGVAAFVTFANVYHMCIQSLAEATWEAGDTSHLEECKSKYDWATENGYHAGLSEFQYAACEYLKQKWREAHPATVAFWSELEINFKLTIKHPNETFDVRHIAFRRNGDWLYIRLPSGRCLTYLKPKFENNQLTFMGQDAFTKSFRRIKTYSGKLAENVTSGTARDIMFHRMPDIEDAGYGIVLRVHDELVCETPDTSEYTHTHLAELMSRGFVWSDGLPLAATGFETHRYRKD